MMEKVLLNDELISHWISHKKEVDKIKEELVSLNYDETTINAYLGEFRKRKIDARQSYGFIFLSAGAFLGFVSCLLSIINPIPSIYYYILYGLTSISVIIIFLGLYYLFE